MLPSQAVSAGVKAVQQALWPRLRKWVGVSGPLELNTATTADLWLHRARAEQQVEAWPVLTASTAAAVQPAQAKYVSGQVGFSL